MLFEDEAAEPGKPEEIAPGAIVIRGLALTGETDLLDAIGNVAAESPFRHMMTARGFRMSVAMTNCGSLGWVSDQAGYRYDAIDPERGLPWPPMPACFLNLARNAAGFLGCANFTPDACLVNRYEPGAKMGLHQDKDELDLRQPIVSMSLGLPAVFQFGGSKRSDPVTRIPLVHGDVVVWGGPARLNYHGVLQLKEGNHRLLGSTRINLTFRKAR